MSHRGRGAQSANTPTRFGLAAREDDGEWLDERSQVDGPHPRVRTTVTIEHPRSILSFNTSPDIPFDRSINAYRGCDHPGNSCVNSIQRNWGVAEPCLLLTVTLGSFSGVSKIVAQRAEKELPENQAKANYTGNERDSDSPCFGCIGGADQPADCQGDKWQTHPRYNLSAHLIDERQAIQWKSLSLQICTISRQQIRHMGIFVARSLENGNLRETTPLAGPHHEAA